MEIISGRNRHFAGGRAAKVNSNQKSAEKPIVTSFAHGWNNVLVESFNLAPAQTPKTNHASHGLFIQTGAARKSVLRDVGGQMDSYYVPGEIDLFPAGFTKTKRSEPTEFTAIHLEKQFVEAAAQDFRSDNRFGLLPQRRVRDEFICRLGEYLLFEAANPNPASKIFVESLATALAVHLIRNYSGGKPNAPETHRGGLAPRKLKTALEFINGHLDEDLSLSDIACEVGLSPFHFARGLKKETGLAPHQYLIEQRIKRAKELLTGTKLPIVEIAFQVGYNTQSHFTSVFRRHTGATPKSFRLN
jgi:AraC family transcriptional regulator